MLAFSTSSRATRLSFALKQDTYAHSSVYYPSIGFHASLVACFAYLERDIWQLVARAPVAVLASTAGASREIQLRTHSLTRRQQSLVSSRRSTAQEEVRVFLKHVCLLMCDVRRHKTWELISDVMSSSCHQCPSHQQQAATTRVHRTDHSSCSP